MVSSVQVFKLFMGCLIEIFMSHAYKPSSFKHNLSGQFILLKIYKVAVVEHLVAAVEPLAAVLGHIPPVLELVDVVVEHFAEFED